MAGHTGISNTSKCVWDDESLAVRCYNESTTGKITQKDVYVRLGSPEWIMNYVMLTSKPFGSVMENYIRNALCLDRPTDSGHDAKCLDVNVEIKSARLWAPTKKEWKRDVLDESRLDAKFQHLEEKHDFKVLLVCLLGSQYVKCWAIKRDDVFGKMMNDGTVTVQGKNDGSSKEGHWFEFQKATKNGHIGIHNMIMNKDDLELFTKSL